MVNAAEKSAEIDKAVAELLKELKDVRTLRIKRR